MWDDARQMNAISAVLALFAAVALSWAGIAWLLRQPAFAFREVIVTIPPERTSAAHLEAAIRAELSGTFFTMNLDRARVALARVPWVRNVALRRQWPQRLEVTIEEHVPLARWNDGRLVNMQGEVFAADYNDVLPQFEGPEGTSAQVAGRYGEWKETLSQLGLTLDGLRLSPRGGWHLAARGAAGPLAIELGREDPTARLEHFATAYGRTIDTLARSGTRIEHVDLRYRNGFAARVPGFKERPPKKPGASHAKAPAEKGMG
jgi:cell division protein FtsQ